MEADMVSEHVRAGLIAAGLAVVLLMGARAVWLTGIDTGAVIMQCVDYTAIDPKWAETKRVCREAAENAHSSALWHLFHRRDQS